MQMRHDKGAVDGKGDTMIITASSRNLIGAIDPKGWSSISIAARNSITLLQLKSHHTTQTTMILIRNVFLCVRLNPLERVSTSRGILRPVAPS